MNVSYQILTHRSCAKIGDFPQEQAAIAARQTDAYFDPASIASSSPQHTGNAQLDTPPNRATTGAMGDSPEHGVRLGGAHQRFRSLQFEGEEGMLPGYADNGIRNSESVTNDVRRDRSG